MILNRTHRFLFLHIPKTAGTTVTAALSRFSQPGDIEVSDPPELVVKWAGKEMLVWKHISAEELRAFIGEQDYANLFKFSFVRNPYTRAYSLYRFLKFNHTAWEGSEIMDKFKNFDEFVASDFFMVPGSNRLLEPQTAWLCDGQGKLLVDHVAHVENIDAELDAVSKKIGLVLSPVEPLNVSERDSPLPTFITRILPALRRRKFLPRASPAEIDLRKVYANERTRRSIEERYKSSFDTFGYAYLEPAH